MSDELTKTIPLRRVYPHRHLITDGAMVTSVTSSRDAAAGTHSAHGNAAAAADEADEAESAAALLDSYRSLHSSVSISQLYECLKQGANAVKLTYFILGDSQLSSHFGIDHAPLLGSMGPAPPTHY